MCFPLLLPSHRAGFTTGTGDGLVVVSRFVRLDPANNTLAPYLPALRRIDHRLRLRAADPVRAAEQGWGLVAAGARRTAGARVLGRPGRGSTWEGAAAYRLPPGREAPLLQTSGSHPH